MTANLNNSSFVKELQKRIIFFYYRIYYLNFLFLYKIIAIIIIGIIKTGATQGINIEVMLRKTSIKTIKIVKNGSGNGHVHHNFPCPFVNFKIPLTTVASKIVNFLSIMSTSSIFFRLYHYFTLSANTSRKLFKFIKE